MSSSIDEPLLRKVIDRALQLANIQNVNYSIELFEGIAASCLGKKERRKKDRKKEEVEGWGRKKKKESQGRKPGYSIL